MSSVVPLNLVETSGDQRRRACVAVHPSDQSNKLTITASESTTDIIDRHGCVDVGVLIPGSMSSGTFYASDAPTGTFPAVTSAGALAVTPGQWFTFPAATLPYRYLKLVGDTGGDGKAVGQL